MPNEPDIRDCGTHLIFKIHVLPRSSRNAFAGTHLDALKIKLTAPPVEGEANRMVLGFLSKALGVSKGTLAIDSGQSSRTKRIRVTPSGSDAKTEIGRVQKLLAARAVSKKAP